MPDPQLPGIVRVHAIQHSASNMPKDDVVNAWAFRNDAYDATIQFGTTAAQRAALAGVLGDFYRAIPNLATTASFTQELTIKGYDLGQPAGVRDGGAWLSDPREPWEEVQILNRSGAASLMPEEVAIVATIVGLRNLPRQRGRVYLGPFTSAIAATGDGMTRVSSAMLTAINGAMAALRGSALAAGWTLGIVSQRDAGFVEARSGWVDNAFDTQRRRGPDPSARLVWDVAGD